MRIEYVSHACFSVVVVETYDAIPRVSVMQQILLLNSRVL